MQAQVKPLSRTETSAKRPFPWRGGPLRGAVARTAASSPVMKSGQSTGRRKRRLSTVLAGSIPARPDGTGRGAAARTACIMPGSASGQSTNGNEPFMTGLDRARPHRTKPRRRSPDRLHQRATKVDDRQREAACGANHTSRRQSRRHGRTPSLRPIHRRLTLAMSIRAAWLSGRPDEPSIKVDGTFA